MVNISIDVTDLGGEARPGDKVVLWKPAAAGSSTHAGRVISTAPVDVFLTNGKATVPDVEPGSMRVLLQCRGVESQGPIPVTVPDGTGTVTLRSLIESQFEYSPPIVSAVQQAADNAAASERAAIQAQVRSEAAADRADAKVDDAINNGANLVRNEVKQDADRAVSAKQAAAQSESNAKASETAAATSASNAKSSETNAKTSETNAASSAASAKSQQESALTHLNNTVAEAGKAAGSAAAAKTSETKAASSASASASSASSSKTQADKSAASATQAGAARDAAKASETAAASSAAAAKTSETNAAQSSSTANTHRVAAEQAKSAADSSKSAAATSASAASSSASKAATSATGAANSATLAGTHASKSLEHANRSEDARDESRLARDEAVQAAQNAQQGAPADGWKKSELSQPVQDSLSRADTALQSIPAATESAPGAIRLTGDLGGTANAPTVPRLEDKSDKGHTHTWESITQRPNVPVTDAGYGRYTAEDLPHAYTNGVSVAMSGANQGWNQALAVDDPDYVSNSFVVVLTIKNANYVQSTTQMLFSYTDVTRPVYVRKSNSAADGWTSFRKFSDDGHKHNVADINGAASKDYVNSRPALFSGAGAPPSSIPGAVVGDWWLDTSTMELHKITGV